MSDIFDAISAGSLDDAAALLQDFTRSKLTRWHHIPHRYFMPPESNDDVVAFSTLAKEIRDQGYIELGADGTPQCLRKP